MLSTLFKRGWQTKCSYLWAIEWMDNNQLMRVSLTKNEPTMRIWPANDGRMPGTSILDCHWFEISSSPVRGAHEIQLLPCHVLGSSVSHQITFSSSCSKSNANKNHQSKTSENYELSTNIYSSCVQKQNRTCVLSWLPMSLHNWCIPAIRDCYPSSFASLFNVISWFFPALKHLRWWLAMTS